MIRIAAACAALALAGLAQETPRPRTLRAASKALHAAWLREVLDGDVPRAVQDYAAIAANDDPNNPHRWIAIARLLELQRVGVAVPQRDLDRTPPAALRPAFEAAAAPLPAAELLQRAAAAPEQVMAAVGSESGRLPALRAATAAAQSWLRERLGTYDRRQRQGIPGQRNRPDRARAERVYAADILQREIEGRQEQAESLRKFYFVEWRAPAIPTDHAEGVRKVRAGIEAWITEKDTSANQQSLLRALREAFDQRVAVDAAAALAFVARMPVYADRLFAAPAGGATNSR